MAGSYHVSIVNFGGAARSFSIGLSPFYILTSNAQRFQLLLILTNTGFCLFCFSLFILGTSHPNDYEVVSHCDFDLHFPKVMFSTICTSSLEREMSVQVRCPLFNGVVCFIVVSELVICLFIYHYFLRISSLLHEVVLGLGQVPNVEYEIPLLRMNSKAAISGAFVGRSCVCYKKLNSSL